MEKTTIEKYAEQEGFRIAQLIEDKMAIVIKPRPKYCPEWLYKKIVRDSVEIVKVQS